MASQTFYSINKVSFSDLCAVLRHRCRCRGAKFNVDCFPTVHFDVNWLSIKLSTKTCIDSSKDVLSLATQFAKENIKVVLTCDNSEYRHQSKKAYIQRDQQCEKCWIDVIFLKKITADGKSFFR